MTLSGLLVFAAAYTLAVATPGPGVAAVVARGLGRGRAGLLPFILGFTAGDLIWFTVAAAGLSVIAHTFETVFTVIKYAGCAYLLWLAWKAWTAPVAVAGDEGHGGAGRESPLRLFLGSLSLTLGNPKVIVFFMALLPSLVDLQSLSLPAFLEIAALMAVIITSVLGGYALLAARARRLFCSPRALRRINRTTGVILAGTAAAIAAR
jgi:threonine/homoserine/homoserine lactone efflux protein